MKRNIVPTIVLCLTLGAFNSHAAVKYWDINGPTAGAGGPSPTGTWDTTSSAWTTDPTGSSATTTWTDGDTAIFSAGSDATGSYTNTLSAARTVGGLVVKDGTVTFAGSAIGLGTSTATVSNGAIMAFGLSTAFTASSGAALVLDNGTARILGALSTGSPFWNVNSDFKLGPGGGTIDVNAGGIGQYQGANGFTLTPGTTVATMTKTGAGEYRSQKGTFAKLVVNQGLWRINATSGLETGFGAVPATYTADAITVNNAGVGTGIAIVTPSQRGITVSSGVCTFVLSAGWTINSIITGPGGIALNGNGFAGTSQTLILGGANSYQGDTVVNLGTLRLGASGVIPDTSLITLAASGVNFDLNGFDETVRSISGTVGTITLGGRTLTLDNPNGESFTSTITGSGGKIVKNGSGKLILSPSTGSYDGGVTLNAGSLGVTVNSCFGTGPLTINNSVTIAAASTTGTRGPIVSRVDLNGDLTFDDSFAATPSVFNWPLATPWTIKGANRTINVNTAAGGYVVTINGIVGQDTPGRRLTKTGNGILAFGATNTYSGDTTVLAGQIQVTGTGTVGDGISTIHLSGGGLNTSASRVAGSAPISNPIDLTTDAAITTSSGASQVELNLNSTSIGGSGTLTFRNDGAGVNGVFQPRFTAGGLVLNLPIVIKNGAIGSTMLQCYNSNTAPAQTFNGVVSGTGSFRRAGSAQNVGGDTIFTAANTYSGGTILFDGGIGLGINSVGSPTVISGPIGTGPVTVTPFASNAKLFAYSGPRVLGNAITFVGSPLTLTGANDLELSGAISLGSSTRTINVDNTGLSTISGTIGSTGGGLTKSGAGALVLSAANTYSGDTTIGAGTVVIGNPLAIPSGNGKGNLSVSGILDLDGKSIAINGLSGSGVISNGVAGPVTLTVGSTNASAVFSGALIDGVGNLSLVKVGTNALILSGANTFSGGTTISNGTLVVSNAALASAVNVTAGGILAGSGAIPSTIDLSGTISPGASPGTFTTAAENWNGGGRYLWQINNATNVPGSDPGWDLLLINGGLNITAAPTNKFTIDVASLSANVPGLIDGFDASASNVWLIAQVTDAITNFDANAIHIIQTGFSNDLGGQIFAIAVDNDTNLLLTLKTNSAPTLTVPADLTIGESTTLMITNIATDPDAGTVLTFSLLSPPAGMTIDPATGIILWPSSPGRGMGTFTITAFVSDDAQAPLSTTNTFNVTVADLNSPPTFTGPGDQTIDELTTLNVSSAATDSDIPANTLTYTLDTAPAGMTLDSGTGAISWSTTETDGQGIYTVKVVATDDGTPPLSTTNIFTVTVNEVNTAPSLIAPADQTINEQAPLSISASATDSDIPANTLTFSLPSAPAGMTIDPNAGAIVWTPTETDGPGVFTIAVAVTDNGSPSLSVTNTFSVTVNEVNNPPSLFVPADQTVDELTSLNVSASATDPDLPANQLAFSLGAHPSGMTIVPGTGAISWTPSEAQGPSTNVVEVIVADDGLPPFSVTNAFTVIVREVNAAPSLTVAADQTIDELASLTVTNTATDSDIPPNTLVFSLGNHPDGMTITPDTGIIDWTPTEAQGPSSNLVEVVVTDDGLPAISTTNTFVVMVNEVNSAPSLTMPANQTINELAALTVSASATDDDLPANTLTFSLSSAPVGMIIDPTTGAITWTPTEADGPAVYTVAVAVTDDGAPALSVTNSFTVTVNEVNSAPSLFVPADQTINELATLNVSASATDPDLPANPLAFSLGAHPSGMTIVPGTGAISWTPSEAQGPSTNVVEVIVTDNGVPAISVTNTFSVTVNEVNVAPTLTVATDQTIDELTSLNVTNSASDSDLPANTLTFSLGNHPTGMTITPDTGIIDWTPTEAQGPSSNLVEVVLTDDGTPPLSVTNTFVVLVNEVNSAPTFTGPGNQTINELMTLNVSAAASDSDIPANTLTYALLDGPAGMTLDSTTGAILWPTTEADGPGVYTVSVVVTDDGTPSLSATNIFTVTVNEVNTSPILTVPADQTINELATLNVSASATDSDLPANTLAFSLVSPPAGMTIVPDTGAISWTPAEEQGPSTNVITVVVTDNGTPSMSATNTFTITVNEVNTSPLLPAIAARTIHAGQSLIFTNSATDSDVPANTLIYTLDPGAPATASVGASSGIFTWATAGSDANTTNAITVRVTDDGTPALDDTKPFTVTVVSAPTATISVSGNVVTISWTAIAGQSYRVQYKNNLDDAIWTDLTPDVTSSDSTASTTDSTVSQRFYRVAVLP